MGDIGEIAKAVEPLINNLAKLTGPMSEELGQYFGDKVRAFRHRNVSTIINGSIKRLEKAGKPINPVPPRLLLPIIDAASVEDNPTLQDMWSGLLASASDQADDMSPSYTETLKALKPIEARSIQVLYDIMIESPTPTLGSESTVSTLLVTGLGLAEGESIAPILIIETLERLGLIRRKYDLQSPAAGDFLHDLLGGTGRRYPQAPAASFFGDSSLEPLPEVIYEWEFTSFGVQFMRACQGPVSRPERFGTDLVE